MVDAIEVVAAGGTVAHPSAVLQLVERAIGRCFGGEISHYAGWVAVGEGVGLPAPELIQVQRHDIKAEEVQDRGLHYSQLLASIIDINVSPSDPKVLLEPPVAQSGDPGSTHATQVNRHTVRHFMMKNRHHPFS